MPRKNRGYKKGEPFRDARLFVIACEGAKREKIYFETLANENQRIKVQVLSPALETPGKSAPRWVMDRAIQYVEEFGLAKDDQLWLVMDTDCWSEKALREIAQHCKESLSWNLALSNPYFEVWLYMHLKDLPKDPVKTCNDLKQSLHTSVPGGYKVEVFVMKIDDAIQRAESNDNHPEYDLPAEMETKVYKLAKAIDKFL